MSKFLAVFTIIILLLGCSEKKEEGAYRDHHGHEHTPHLGIMAEFKVKDGASKGFVELKLHDDKGDLELWLTNDKDGAKPYDLPLDATINVSFTKLGKEVQLKIRNKEKNEDEDGKGNIRKDKTNYFIFPGDTGADASYLMGKDFSSEVKLSFTIDGKEYYTDTFTLEPHVH